ncbi:V-set domain containing T-cell activation inhibitor 1-like [Enoplosus armatus]|uniref:V-set domain containing T-cell activation inhibitor 1-like n=1 Tax=Enoplosus armatus TaxID=215367 RepID=UPI003996004C
MTGIKSVVFVVVLTFLHRPARGDVEVSCDVTESCVLPCSFQNGTNAVIHWILVAAGDPHVHSYYDNKDQLGHQDSRFRNRTSLFRDQISGGNASLQLTGVQIQDQGRYKCYTRTISGNKESFINLKVAGRSSNVGGIAGGVIGAIGAISLVVLVVSVAACIYKRCKNKCATRTGPENRQNGREDIELEETGTGVVASPLLQTSNQSNEGLETERAGDQ